MEDNKNNNKEENYDKFYDIDNISTCEDEFVDESYKDDDEIIEEPCKKHIEDEDCNCNEDCECEECSHEHHECNDECCCHEHKCDHIVGEPCILYDNKICNDCGECEMCDLDPTKVCNNCGKCLEEYALPQDEKGFFNFEAKLDNSGMTLEDIYTAYGLNDDSKDGE